MYFTYKELEARNFSTYRLAVKKGELPEYLGFQEKLKVIIAKRIIEDEYELHVIRNSNGINLSEEEIEDLSEARDLENILRRLD